MRDTELQNDAIPKAKSSHKEYDSTNLGGKPIFQHFLHPTIEDGYIEELWSNSNRLHQPAKDALNGNSWLHAHSTSPIVRNAGTRLIARMAT